MWYISFGFISSKTFSDRGCFLKNNSWTQTTNQNKWRSKHPFLPHVRAQTHIQFFPSRPNQSHTLQKILKTSRICGHFHNKPYKTTSRFLSKITILGKHHIKRKLNQNRKQSEIFFFTLCHHTFENRFLFLFLITSPLSPSSPQLQPRHHNIDNFLRHHIIVNIFPWNKIWQNPFHLNLSLLFSYQLPKMYLQFQNQKLWWNLIHLTLILSQVFCYHYAPSTIVKSLLTCFQIEKLRKQSLSEEV